MAAIPSASPKQKSRRRSGKAAPEIEIAERPGDLYSRPAGPIPKLYPRPASGPRTHPATDAERSRITGPLLARMRRLLADSEQPLLPPGTPRPTDRPPAREVGVRNHKT